MLCITIASWLVVSSSSHCSAIFFFFSSDGQITMICLWVILQAIQIMVMLPQCLRSHFLASDAAIFWCSNQSDTIFPENSVLRWNIQIRFQIKDLHQHIWLVFFLVCFYQPTIFIPITMKVVTAQFLAFC